MYDEDIDDNNPMFDLNREIIREQRGITIITRDNVTEIAKKLINDDQSFKNTTASQINLF
jgi:DNA processing protein